MDAIITDIVVRIHNETSGILYADNVPEVTVTWCSVVRMGIIESVQRLLSVEVGGAMLAEIARRGEYSLQKVTECWNQAQLKMFKRIDVKMYVYDDTAPPGMIIQQLVQSANQALYSLCSLLGMSKALKQLDVQVRDS